MFRLEGFFEPPPATMVVLLAMVLVCTCDGSAEPAAAPPSPHSVSSLRWSHHDRLQDAILSGVMNRLLPALLCLLAACAAPAAGGVSGDTVLSVQPDGEELKAELCSFVLSTQRRQGRMVVELDLKNSSERAIDFAWSVEWMDRSGAALPGAAAVWRALRLEAGERTPIEIEAPHPSASSWRLITVER